MKSADLKIKMNPQEIIWNCPYCGKEQRLSYDDFIIFYGYEWQYKTCHCDKCRETYYFDSEG